MFKDRKYLGRVIDIVQHLDTTLLSKLMREQKDKYAKPNKYGQEPGSKIKEQLEDSISRALKYIQ